MGGGILIGLVAGVAGALNGKLGVALPLVLLWVTSPAIAQILAHPPTRRALGLAAQDRGRALRYALLHWRFFDHFVSDATSGLAPDNFQETPEPVLAERTSPTNIGMGLLATMTGYDLGYIDADATDLRVSGFA